MRRGGVLLIEDFGPPHTRWGRWVAPLMRHYERLSDHLDGRLLSVFRQTSFENVQGAARFATIFGTLAILSGRKPD